MRPRCFGIKNVMAKQRKKNKKPFLPTHPKSQIIQPPDSPTTMQISRHQGPLPSPDVLEHYDNILPGAAERIVSMAEDQAKHRQNLEYITVKAGSRDSLLGLIFGFIIGMSTIVGGVYCIMKGQPTEGTILSGAGLAALVGVFVYGSSQRKAEREAKQQASK